jgi:hypothetical protein
MITFTSLLTKVLLGYINLGESTHKPSQLMPTKLVRVSILLMRQVNHQP